MNSTPIRNYRDLDAWKVSMELAEGCYRLCKLLPAEERFVLSAQIRRAAISVASNIAEGHASGSSGLFGKALKTALGSLAEVATQLDLAIRLDLLPTSQVEPVMEMLARTRQLLHGLVRSVRKRGLRTHGTVGAALLVLLLVA